MSVAHSGQDNSDNGKVNGSNYAWLVPELQNNDLAIDTTWAELTKSDCPIVEESHGLSSEERS